MKKKRKQRDLLAKAEQGWNFSTDLHDKPTIPLNKIKFAKNQRTRNGTRRGERQNKSIIVESVENGRRTSPKVSRLSYNGGVSKERATPRLSSMSIPAEAKAVSRTAKRRPEPQIEQQIDDLGISQANTCVETR
jgi:hypothetical protein